MATEYGTLTDYTTGEDIRPATADEHARSLAAGETGAFDLDCRAVFVAGGPERSTADHFTAWLTTDTSALDQGCADVVVLADENTGDDTSPNWASTGDPIMQAATTVDAANGDASEARTEAESLLWQHGWRLAGQWDGVPTGYVVTVERATDAD